MQPANRISTGKSLLKKVVFWGATGQAKVLNEALPENGGRLVALVDRRDLKPPLPGIELLRGDAELVEWLKSQTSCLYFAVAIGGRHGADRIELRQRLVNLGLTPLTVVHRTAFVASDAVVGNACQILAQSAVCSHTTLGQSVIVNTRASVDHDCYVGDGSHIGPGATVAGDVRICPRVFIGAGAVILPHLNIGADATVGAGAVVTKNVPPSTTVVGIPATPILLSKGKINE